MQKTLEIFKKWGVEDKQRRHDLFAVSCADFCEENILYLICCHDYVFNPDDEKMMGLEQLFIKSQKGGGTSSLEINVGYIERKKALALLASPLILAKVEMLAHLKQPGSLIRGGPKITQSHYKFEMFVKKGGRRRNGAANYNLMTQAIELTLPVCLKQARDNDNLTEFFEGKLKNIPPIPGPGLAKIRRIAKYWGVNLMMLGVT